MNYRWFLVGAMLVGVALFVIFLLPFFLNAASFRPAIERQLSNVLGREVTLGRLSFSLLHGSLVSDEFVVSDDPEFSKVPFLQAKGLEVGVEILPLLVHGRVHVTTLTVYAPSIQLIQHASGRWNYSTLGSKPSQDAAAQGPSSLDLDFGELKVVNGGAMVSSIPVAARPFEYSNINVTLKDFAFAKSFPIEVSADLPGGGTVKLTGNAGPLAREDISETPFHATLQVREFDLVGAGIVEPSKGIMMTNDIDGEINSDGIKAASTGKIKASRLQFVPKGSPSQQPVDIHYNVSENLATREGTVSDIAIHTGQSAVHVNGTFKFTAETLMLNLHLSASALAIESLEQLLPSVGIRLPSGSSLQGGTLSASIAVAGPATGASMAGPIEIDNTKLAGFDLGSKIEGIPQLGGTSAGTEIRALKSNVASSTTGTRLKDISVDIQQIGTATGEGVVAPSGELEIRLTAKLKSSGAGASPVRIVPVFITGTAASPTIRASAGAGLR